MEVMWFFINTEKTDSFCKQKKDPKGLPVENPLKFIMSLFKVFFIHLLAYISLYQEITIVHTEAAKVKMVMI